MFLILLQLEPQGNILGGFLPLILIVVVFYFFMIRPQIKKQKAEKFFNDKLKRGDRVVTSGGIHGKISEIKDRTVILEIEGNRLKVERTSISKDLSTQYLKKKDN